MASVMTKLHTAQFTQ